MRTNLLQWLVALSVNAQEKGGCDVMNGEVWAWVGGLNAAPDVSWGNFLVNAPNHAMPLTAIAHQQWWWLPRERWASSPSGHVAGGIHGACRQWFLCQLRLWEENGLGEWKEAGIEY